MTTLAYRDGVMAADSRTMLGGWKTSYPVPKLFRLDDGSVCGVNGDYPAAVAFKDWLNSDRAKDRPALTDSGVIQMVSDGLIIHESSGSFSLTTEFGAWGSGSPAAYGALHAGSDAVRAVEIAALVDDCTGGPICFMTLNR